MQQQVNGGTFIPQVVFVELQISVQSSSSLQLPWDQSHRAHLAAISPLLYAGFLPISLEEMHFRVRMKAGRCDAAPTHTPTSVGNICPAEAWQAAGDTSSDAPSSSEKKKKTLIQSTCHTNEPGHVLFMGVSWIDVLFVSDTDKSRGIPGGCHYRGLAGSASPRRRSGVLCSLTGRLRDSK